MEFYEYLSYIFSVDMKRNLMIVFLCMCIIAIAATIDMWTAIDASKVSKQPIESRKLRVTISKLIDYYRVVMYFTLIDTLGFIFSFYSVPFICIIATIGILLIEGKSIIKENIAKKREAIGELPDIISDIINAVTEKDAENIIKKINELNEKKKK